MRCQVSELDETMVSGWKWTDESTSATRAQRRIWIWLVGAILAVSLYPSAFFWLRHRYNVTSGYSTRMRIYYFSSDPVLNDYLWVLFYPLHRSIAQPVTDNEWRIEYKNEESLYLRDVRPIEQTLKQ